jgi:hypothetical protein
VIYYTASWKKVGNKNGLANWLEIN